MTTNTIDLLDIKLNYEQLKQLKQDWNGIGVVHYYDTRYSDLPLHKHEKLDAFGDLKELACAPKDKKDGIEAVLTIEATGDGPYSWYALVGKANNTYLSEYCSDLPGLKQVVGGMGTYVVAFDVRLFFLEDEDGDLIADGLIWELERLREEAILDDDEYNLLMYEAYEDAWDDFESDFLTLISEKFGLDADSLTENQVKELRTLFYDIAHEKDAFTNTEGDTIYIDVQRICTFITEEQIQPTLELTE